MTVRFWVSEPRGSNCRSASAIMPRAPNWSPCSNGCSAVSSQLSFAVTIGFSRDLLDAYDAGALDAVIVRQESSRRGGEKLTEDSFGWFATPRFKWQRGESLRLATLAPPCGVRAIAVRALDKAGIEWNEAFVGGGVSATVAAALAGLGVAPLARRIAPPGMVDIGPECGLPPMPKSKVMLHSKVADPLKLSALAHALGGVSECGGDVRRHVGLPDTGQSQSACLPATSQ